MPLVVPVLSLIVLVVAISGLWLSGQHHKDVLDADLFKLWLYVPYLLPMILFIQGFLIYLQLKSKRQKGLINDEVIKNDSASALPPCLEQINTEWVLDALAGGVILVNLQGNITYMNPSAEKMTLWSRHKAVGLPVINVLKLEDLKGNPLLGHVFETHRAHPAHSLQFGQVKLYPRVGDYRYVELSTTYIQDEHKVLVFIFRDVTADRKVINRLYQQASRDPLTDLMNRSSFEQYVEQLAHDTSGLIRTHVLASLDLDNFKIINDTCGHLAGDELLKQVAQIFRRCIRNSDKVARIGGDEFAVFLEGCSAEKGRSIMELILTELRNFRFSWESKIFSIGASIGLVEFAPSNHVQIKQLFAAADKACYTAKALGHNQVFVHISQETQPMPSQRVDDWGKLLKTAIQEDRFMLFVQPITPLRPEHMHAPPQFEVLLRLPFRQALLNPGSFLPVANRLELTSSIDRWIIKKSLELLVDFRKDKTPGGVVEHRLMINLSAQSVQSTELLPFVDKTIKQLGLNPSMVCFEISESVAVGNFVHTKRLMNALHEIGCYLVLDDFGSGFSSLNYIRELPLSYLKIDGNFVHNLVSNPVDAAMVKAVHEVGQVMKLLTIAELVEDAETLNQLKQIGVDFAQGYYCGRPLPLLQLHQYIQSTIGPVAA